MSEDASCEHLVMFEPEHRGGYITTGKTIWEASRELGVGMESICGGNATCGKCKVRIQEGLLSEYAFESKMAALSPLGEEEKRLLTASEQQDGYRLACQSHVHGDVVVFVPEESRLDKQVARKVVNEVAVDLNPSVKKYRLRIARAGLEGSPGDCESLRSELSRQIDLSSLTIDYQLLTRLQTALRQGNWEVTVSIWMGREAIAIEPGFTDRAYGLAVDIGTTTVAAYLCDLVNGEVLATDSITNPQIVFGEDVISRISYAMTHEDGLRRMNEVIVAGVNAIAGRLAARSGVELQSIMDITVVGNTCMHHVFLNLDPQHLGKAPFIPCICHSLDVKARDVGLTVSPGAYVHMLPVEAAFVGSDNVGVAIAEASHDRDGTVLIVDIGTNGELLMSNRGRLVSSSCATGPTFEGAGLRHGMRAAPGAIEKVEIDAHTKQVRFKVIGREAWNTDSEDVLAKGICGSGVIDAIAHMFVAGIIDRTGRFNIELETTRLRVTQEGPEFVIAWKDETCIGQDIVIRQQDVRNVQLAKAAVYAGVKVMMGRLHVVKLDRVILAGAFGSCIDKESAAIIGLFPDCALGNVSAVGNAAGKGACITLLNVAKRTEADEIARRIEYVELTTEGSFNRHFAQAMWFPHMEDAFPALERLLGEGSSVRKGCSDPGLGMGLGNSDILSAG